MSERPRILLVPTITELEWLIRPLLEEWADVASYDPPGVGEEPASESPLFDAVAERGMAELDRRGWSRCVVVADEFGIGSALRIARAHPEVPQGLALGHACLSLRREGERAPLNGDVFDAFMQLMKVDYRTFVHQDLQIWDPRRGGGGSRAFDREELAERWLERVPPERVRVLADRIEAELDALGDFGPTLRELGVPMLFVEHEGCVAFTSEGYEDAVAAFPEARTLRLPVAPNASREFAEALREFCEAVAG